MAKKSNTKKFLGQVGLISIIIAVIFLVIYLITIITSSSAFYTSSAETNAKIHFQTRRLELGLLQFFPEFPHHHTQFLPVAAEQIRKAL